MGIDDSHGDAESRSPSTNPSTVIPGLVPGTHFPEAVQNIAKASGKWMAGTGPAMTDLEKCVTSSASPRLRVQNSEVAALRVVQIARSWIGTPYMHQASVKGVGCDCLGLLRGVWRELRGEEPEDAPPYSPVWAEATGDETLYKALKRHLTEIDPRSIAPGDVALFRMAPRGPAKHCGIVGERNPPLEGGSKNLKRSERFFGEGLTLIHARQNKRVSEEMFGPFWRRKQVATFRMLTPRANSCSIGAAASSRQNMD